MHMNNPGLWEGLQIQQTTLCSVLHEECNANHLSVPTTTYTASCSNFPIHSILSSNFHDI